MRYAGPVLALIAVCFVGSVSAQSRVESNVVYGMYSGLALLMDAYYPATPNGAGVVVVAGSSFMRDLAMNAAPLKEAPIVGDFAKTLTAAGYVVFALNHRAAPRFQLPAPVEDVQRAIRFVRSQAARFGVTPDRIAAVGASSGGHLVSMVATLDGAGDPADPDPINRLSSKVRTVVALYAPFDLAVQFKQSGGEFVGLAVGAWLTETMSPTSVEAEAVRERLPHYARVR